jgi:hypothetical protein
MPNAKFLNESRPIERDRNRVLHFNSAFGIPAFGILPNVIGRPFIPEHHSWHV